jgi:hypothetical protein
VLVTTCTSSLSVVLLVFDIILDHERRLLGLQIDLCTSMLMSKLVVDAYSQYLPAFKQDPVVVVRPVADNLGRARSGGPRQGSCMDVYHNHHPLHNHLRQQPRQQSTIFRLGDKVRALVRKSV